MRLISKIVALLTIAAGISATSVAQEPTKEETVQWLQEKIPEASLGCRRIMNMDPDTAYHREVTDHYKYRLIFKSDTNLPTMRIETETAYITGDKAGQTESFSSQYTFRPSSITTVSIQEPENQIFENGTTAVLSLIHI